MPKRNADLLLEDVRSAIARIERYTSGLEREQFLADEKTIEAVLWDQIAGLRKRIVHDYFGLDLEIIWQVLQTSLPELRKQLDDINR